MIQKRNASMVSLLAPNLFKNRGEAYWMPIYVVAPYNAAKESVILVTTGGAPIPIQLPPTVNQIAKVYAIKKIDAGVGTVDITPTVPDLIDGAPIHQLAIQYETVIIVSDGAVPPGNWWIISQI